MQISVERTPGRCVASQPDPGLHLFEAPHYVEGEPGTHKLDLGDGVLIHGTRDEDSVGTRASHGCIRLRNADVERLFHAVPVGTPVRVR